LARLQKLRGSERVFKDWRAIDPNDMLWVVGILINHSDNWLPGCEDPSRPSRAFQLDSNYVLLCKWTWYSFKHNDRSINRKGKHHWSQKTVISHQIHIIFCHYFYIWGFPLGVKTIFRDFHEWWGGHITCCRSGIYCGFRILSWLLAKHAGWVYQSTWTLE
jgi:hypothetical protein